MFKLCYVANNAQMTLTFRERDRMIVPLAGMQQKKEKKTTGEWGHRSPYLPHAKRALYHLS